MELQKANHEEEEMNNWYAVQRLASEHHTALLQEREQDRLIGAGSNAEMANTSVWSTYVQAAQNLHAILKTVRQMLQHRAQIQ